MPGSISTISLGYAGRQKAECLCLVHEARLDADEPSLGFGLTTDPNNKEICKIAMPCLALGLKRPEKVFRRSKSSTVCQGRRFFALWRAVSQRTSFRFVRVKHLSSVLMLQFGGDGMPFSWPAINGIPMCANQAWDGSAGRRARTRWIQLGLKERLHVDYEYFLLHCILWSRWPWRVLIWRRHTPSTRKL